MRLIATLEILKTQLNKFTFLNHVHCWRWCLKKTPAIHETTQDNPKHSDKPAPDFELEIFYLFVEYYLPNGMTDSVHYLKS